MEKSVWEEKWNVRVWSCHCTTLNLIDRVPEKSLRRKIPSYFCPIPKLFMCEVRGSELGLSQNEETSVKCW